MRIGVAGWALSAALKPHFPESGSHLARYAGRFNAVEINSSFYRPHRPQTYARWADSVPDDFRFAVKMPRAITHEARLRDCEKLLDDFLAQTAALGLKHGPLLVQTPPSLGFSPDVPRFLTALRARFFGTVALEPRHARWFTQEAEAVLRHFAIARVGADPARFPAAGEPGGDRRLSYFRLHGVPRIYHSDYAPERIADWADQLANAARASPGVWCIFDNTALGAAPLNALALQARLAATALCS